MTGSPAPHLVLVGMMGSGKSTQAALVAERLGWESIDLDHVVETGAGSTVAEVFATRGEAAFRALEVAALDAALEAPIPTVVATGGGVVATAAGRAALGAVRCVYLRASVDTLVARVGDGEGRPLLSSDPREALEALLAARASSYESIADVVVDVDGLDVDAVTDIICASVEAPC